MVKRILFILAVAFILGVFLVARHKSGPTFECADAIGCVDFAPGEPLKLGLIQDVSGGAAIIGLEQAHSMELAIANRNNQLLGHPIILVSEDSRCTPEGGRVAASKLIADPLVVALLGTTCSGSAVTASKVMSETGLIMVSGANSAPSLTAIGRQKGADWQAGYFRTRHNDAEMGRAAAIFAIQKLGITRVATINDGDAYSKGLIQVFTQAFTELGGKIVLDSTVNKNDTNMKPVLTAVAASGAELIFFPIFKPEAVAIVRQAREVAGVEDVILMGATALVIDDFIETVTTDGVGMYFANSAVLESSAADKLISEYKARYGDAPLTAAYIPAYDAVNLIMNAIEKIAVQEKDGTLHIGRQTLRETLYATADFAGVAGRLTCNEFGDCGAAGFNILRLDDPNAGVEGLKSNIIYPSNNPDNEKK